MKAEDGISPELRETLEAALREMHTVTILEGHNLTDSPGGTDKVWVDLRQREFGLTPTLAHILVDVHVPKFLENRPGG